MFVARRHFRIAKADISGQNAACVVTGRIAPARELRKGSVILRMQRAYEC